MKSCVIMSAAGAAKDSLQRLGQGKHPYKVYNYIIHDLGPVGGWTSHERTVQAGPLVKGPGSAANKQIVRLLGQEVETDIIELSRPNDGEQDAHMGELHHQVGTGFGPEDHQDDEGDPFVWGGGFEEVG
jgi:hypothetical protein